jgi:NitT/TauT family transport system substrate-binding protein
MAVDSINEKGLSHYAPVIMEYCKVDEATVKSLPKLHFWHTTPPRAKDLNRTTNVKWRTS